MPKMVEIGPTDKRVIGLLCVSKPHSNLGQDPLSAACLNEDVMAGLDPAIPEIRGSDPRIKSGD